MSNDEDRRLELKTRVLSSEISQIANEVRIVSGNFKERELKNKLAQISWSKYLKEVVIAYKDKEPRLQLQILNSKIKILSKSKKILINRKQEEKLLENKCKQLLLKNKQKQLQLSKCNYKKESLRLQLKSLNEQARLDELSLLKSMQNLNNINCSNDFIAEDNIKPVSEVFVNNNPISNPPGYDIRNIIVENYAVCGNSTNAKNLTRQNSNLKKEQTLSESLQRKFRLKKLIKSEVAIERQNQRFDFSFFSSSQGSSICCNYYHSPGRMFSVVSRKNPELTQLSIDMGASSHNDILRLKSLHKRLLPKLKSKYGQDTVLQVLE